MAETKTCPKCGAELPDNAPSGICPKCLMLAGLESEQEIGSAADESDHAQVWLRVA